MSHATCIYDITILPHSVNSYMNSFFWLVCLFVNFGESPRERHTLHLSLSCLLSYLRIQSFSHAGSGFSCTSGMHKLQFRNWVVHHQFSSCLVLSAEVYLRQLCITCQNCPDQLAHVSKKSTIKTAKCSLDPMTKYVELQEITLNLQNVS